MASSKRLRLSRHALLAFTLLLTLGWAPPLFHISSPLGSAAAAQWQGNPSACESVGNNWALCDSAFVSDDTYATDAREPPQLARPDADVVVVNWQDSSGNAVHFEEINETSPDDDATYTQTPVDPANGDDAEFNLSNIQDPQVSDGHVLRYRYRNAVFGGGSAQLDLTVELRDGNSTIASWTHPDISSEIYTTQVQTLSTFQADLIGNYSDLRVRFDVTFFSGSQTRQLRLTWVEFEAPGAPLPGAPSDTAWTNFGLGLNASDAVRALEIGVEWFRISNEPILNVTVSWNGGSDWAANQTATNKSADDDLVEWLNFTSAMVWDAGLLNDTNFRVRAGANTSGARLDYLTVRVTYIDAILDLSLSANTPSADPGDLITLNATVSNLGSGAGQNLLIEGLVSPNASYVSSSPGGAYDAIARTVRWSVPSLPAGTSTIVEWDVRVNVGVPDQATVISRGRVEGEDSGGIPAPPDEDLNTVIVRAPAFSPVLYVVPSEAERGDEIEAIVFFNNTGSGSALLAWLNWSLGVHYQLVSLTPPFSPATTPDGFAVALSDVTSGPHTMTARLLVLPGLQDGLPMDLQVDWEATDGNGNPLPGESLPGTTRLLAPSMSLGLEDVTRRIGAGSTLRINASIQNAGGASGTGWLNLSLPAGFRYVADNGTFPVALTEGGVSWRLASIPAETLIALRVELQAPGEARVEAIRLSLDYTDGKGTPPLTVFSSALTVEVVREPVPAWILWLAVGMAAIGGPLALFHVRRRLRAFSIEEVFVMDASGVLVAHLSRTLTPDKDRDILAAMLKTVQDFVADAFSEREESPMRRIEFGRFSILIERGHRHWLAVVFRGEGNTAMEARVAMVSKQIDIDFGEVLATWSGEMFRVRGIQGLLKHLWADEGLRLGPIGPLLDRLRDLWPQRRGSKEDLPPDSDEEEQDPTVAELLSR